MKTKLAIIIPVFNVEKSISNCLNSIVEQLPDDGSVKVYLIDDGSKDQTKNCIEKYLNKYNQLHYIYKENGGVSSARNLGLAEIESEYVAFLDGDDSIRENYISTLLELLKINPEMVCFNAVKKYESGKQSKLLDIKNETIEVKENDGINGYLLSYLYSKLEGYVWNKIYRVSIIKENHLIFDIDQKICEDLLFNVAYIEKINSILCIEDCLYNYNIYEDSACHGYKAYATEEYYKFISKFQNIAENNSYIIPKHNLLAFYLHFWFTVVLTESFSENYRLGLDKIKWYLNNEYFKNNFNEIKFNELSIKRKVYYIFVRFHLSKLLYSMLYLKNHFLKSY